MYLFRNESLIFKTGKMDGSNQHEEYIRCETGHDPEKVGHKLFRKNFRSNSKTPLFVYLLEECSDCIVNYTKMRGNPLFVA